MSWEDTWTFAPYGIILHFCISFVRGAVKAGQWGRGRPASLADSAIADRLDELLHLRDAVDQLAAAELPKGFGRD